jgi:hypothetical protein
MAYSTNPRLANLVGLAVVAREVGVDPATVWRWIRKGVLLGDGSRLYLEGWATPGAWKTSREAVQDFIQRLTEDRQGHRAEAGAVVPRSPCRRAREVAAAERELAAMGL